MCSLNPWQVWGPDGSTITEGPGLCPNGHPLRYPNVLITSNVEHISYGCGTCGAWINRLHDERVEWVTQGRPGRFRPGP